MGVDGQSRLSVFSLRVYFCVFMHSTLKCTIRAYQSLVCHYHLYYIRVEIATAVVLRSKQEIRICQHVAKHLYMLKQLNRKPVW